jgi:hypothetical protein
MIWLWWKDFQTIPRLMGRWMVVSVIVVTSVAVLSVVIAWILQIAQALGVWPYA